MRGWARNTNEKVKKEKEELFKIADDHDKRVLSQLLSQKELDLKQSVKNRIVWLLREEKNRWFQREKTKKLMKGDNNTKHFQMVANCKRQKTRIFQLEQEGIVIGREPLKQSFPDLYSLRRKGDSVAKVLGSTPLNISLRRARPKEPPNLVSLVVPITLGERR